MSVWVGAASRHGSTSEIADAIATELRELGLDATSAPLDSNVDFSSVDAVVVGSAVYMGRWLSEGRSFLESHQDALRSRPVWLFSSGPVGEVDRAPALDPAYIDELREISGAVEHKLLSGNIDPDKLGVTEKVVLKVVRAPSGDFWDWTEIRSWAEAIATRLSPESQSS